MHRRLIWGINDFDEAYPMPYANDLVRLAAGARLAIREKHLACDPDKACDAVLEGYAEAIGKRGEPFVLAEHNRWLRLLAQNKRRHPSAFWGKLQKAREVRSQVPPVLERAFAEDLPATDLCPHFVHREAGVGSLGRQRFTLLAEWKGSMIARESKPLLLSAWAWASGQRGDSNLWHKRIIGQAVRLADPFLTFKDSWVLRRLAPDCCRIELNELPKQRDELRLLRSMGWETANIHLGSVKAILEVKKDLKNRQRRWLRDATIEMEEPTITDWKPWKRYWRNSH